MYAIVLLVLVAICAYCLAAVTRTSLAVKRYLYPPRKPVDPLLNSLEFPELADVSFATSDQHTIHGWYVPPKNKAVILLTHGWGENRAQMLFEAKALCLHHYGVLLFDWRAHGESDGEMTTLGDLERRDLSAAIEFVVAQPGVDPQRIGAVGFSLGAWVVSSVAAVDNRVGAVVIEGAGTSLSDEMDITFAKGKRFRKWAAAWTTRRAGINVDAVMPIKTLSMLSPRPILLINGSIDDIPLEMEKRLFDAIGQPKEYWLVEGAQHGEYSRIAPDEYERRLVKHFDDSLLQLSPNVNTI